MSDIIKKAREVLEGVTPGPWRVGPVDDCRVEDANGNEVAQIDGDYNQPETWPLMEANARFIAWAREGVPALIARAEAAETALAAERAKVAKLVEAAEWAIKQIKHMPMDEASQEDFARHRAAIEAAKGDSHE